MKTYQQIVKETAYNGPDMRTYNWHPKPIRFRSEKSKEKIRKIREATNCTFFKVQISTCSHNLNFGAKTN